MVVGDLLEHCPIVVYRCFLNTGNAIAWCVDQTLVKLNVKRSNKSAIINTSEHVEKKSFDNIFKLFSS